MSNRNHSEIPMVRRPVIGRQGPGLMRIGVPMYWDPDPPPAPPPAGDATPPDPPPPAPSGGGDAAARLAKLERENERLTEALKKRQDAEAKAKSAAEAKEREAAAKRGEWERLYGEEQSKSKTLAEQLESERLARGELETFLSERMEQALKSVEDESVRKTWKAALEGQAPLQAQRTLDALMATLGNAQQSTPSPRPGTPGRSKTTIDLRELSKNTPQTRARLNDIVMAKLKGKA